MRDGYDFWRQDVSTYAKTANIPRRPSVVADDLTPVDAQIVAGRLVAKCPAEGCDGLEIVWFGRPLLWCVTCRNATWEGFWLPVRIPKLTVLALIDQALAVRPEPHRNWVPGETVEALIAENEAHGLVGIAA